MIRRCAALLLAAAALVAGACGGGDDDASTSTTTTSAGGVTTTTSSSGSTSTSPSTSAPDDDAIALVLGPGRLTVGGNALVFGAPESQTTAYLERALGEPVADTTSDCDAGRLRVLRWKGVSAYVDTGTRSFTGWYADDATFATDKGARAGASEADLRRAYPGVEIDESSLGTEFHVASADPDDPSAGLSGILGGDRIEVLWSGATCIAR